MLDGLPDQETRDYIKLSANSQAYLFWHKIGEDETTTANVRLVAFIRTKQLEAKKDEILATYIRDKGRGPKPFYSRG